MSVEHIKEWNKYELKEKIRYLIDQLNVYTKFYDEGNPVISDKEWDDMYFELQALENEFDIHYEDSPTQRVNYQVVNQLNKVEHSHPMLSLDKTKSIEELESFVGNKAYICMAKMDGLTCSLTYEDGKLVRAETRGNGVIGEDILHNALQIKNIPNKIGNKNKFVIDGEVICDYKTFENFSNEYKNPRNFASGSIRLLDSKESAMRRLSFIAWDCIEGLPEEETLNGKIWRLKEMGFSIVPYITNSTRTIAEDIERIQKECEALGYPIDGVVIKYNDVKVYNAAGRTDHHFKGGIAYKFYDEEYETILRDIEWGMGRTGVLTPVAIFDTLDIDGSEVSRASLHNISIMDELGILHKGEKLSIYKANQIIPQVSKAERNPDATEFDLLKIPEICPICGGATVIKQENNSKMLYCDNPLCEGKLVNRLDHFCSKKGLDIKGLSKATLEKLVDWGYINTYQDIFILNQHRDNWIKKPGFGVASVDKILNAIEESKKTSLEKVIAAAGIPEIGTRVAKDLAKHYNSWSEFRAETNFLQYDGIGEVMNNNLLTFDYDDLNLDYTVNLHLNNVEKCANQEQYQDNQLEGKVFCVTGKVHIFKNRAELQADIESKGGKCVSSMSSKVNYLINNDNTSTTSKNLAAKQAGIPIITEEEYLQLNR